MDRKTCVRVIVNCLPICAYVEGELYQSFISNHILTFLLFVFTVSSLSLQEHSYTSFSLLFFAKL